MKYLQNMGITQIYGIFMIAFLSHTMTAQDSGPIECTQSEEKIDDGKLQLIKACRYKTYTFKSTGTTDDSGKYNYVYQINDAGKGVVPTSAIFNDRQAELEVLINIILKSEYDFVVTAPESKGCFEDKDMRNYSLDEMGILFNDKNEVEFHISWGVKDNCKVSDHALATLPLEDVVKYMN